jgi:ligand-binding sensor domain-containing protein/signal transduction histidine kinase/DNA-binding response OmpR family regulator
MFELNISYYTKQLFVFKLNFLLILGLTHSPLSISAQNAKLRFSHIDNRQGLSNSWIEAIYQDDRGFMWFGTRDGLDRYDGYQITVFKNNKTDEHTISDNYIQCLYEDSKRNLWVGTTNGLNRFNQFKNKFTRYKHTANSSSLSNSTVNCIFEDEKKNIWIGTSDGCLNLYQPESNTFKHYFYDHGKSASNNQINYLYEGVNHHLWVGTEKGLKSFDLSKNKFDTQLSFPNGNSYNVNYPVSTIQEDRSGNLWIGTENNGLVAINLKNNTVKNYLHQRKMAGSLSNDQVKCLLTDSKGNVWIGSINGGLDFYNPASDSFVHNQNESGNPGSLSQRTASAIFEDDQHNLWVGTHRGGVNLFSPQASKFRLLENEPGSNSLSYNDVRTFCEDNTRNIWIGTDGGGLNEYNPEKNSFIQYRYDPFNNNGLSSDAVLDLLLVGENRIWISTWGGGLNCLDKNTGQFRHFNYNPSDNNSISSDYVAKCFKDSQGNFWVGTYYGGLDLFDVKTYRFSRFIEAPDKKSKLFGNNVVSINEDKQKNLWIGTNDGGLNCYNLQTQRVTHFFNNQERLPDPRVLFIDHKGRLWLGQEGLYLFDPNQKRFYIYTNNAGLGTEFIKGIEEDDNGNLWISSTNGLTKFNPTNYRFKKYNTADGLQGQEFEVNSVLKTTNGTMYFGGVDGINVFKPSAIESNKFIPPVYITGLQIFNKTIDADTAGSPLSDDISLTKTIRLSYEQSSIALNFAALNYTASANNLYSYKLEGFDKNWYNTNERKASYTNLEPATYTFQVKAANNDGLWNPKSTFLTIIISPPFWDTWWFRTLLGLILLFAGYQLLMFKKNLDLRKIEEAKREEMYQLKLQFFTNISHEFRTPLSLILGPLEVLLENGKAVSLHYYELMYRNANRLLHLINELMDFSKVETGVLALKVRSGNINLFIEELAEEFKDVAIQKNIKINIILNNNNLHAWFDRQVLEKIVMNLVNNSLKYTPVNGEIFVEVSDHFEKLRPKFENELIFMNNFRADKYVYLRICDNGIGISKDSIGHLFERYYRIAESHLGSGIGLAFVKSLTLLHKGDIYVYSQRHKGTDIIIGLPVGENDYQESEKWAEINQEGDVKLESIHMEPLVTLASSAFPVKGKTNNTTHKYRILVVEDNEEIRLFIKSSLENHYNISEAADGNSGIIKAKDDLPDLIISDVMMPGMNGIDFCLSIKEDIETSHIPFIMLTAKTNLQAEIEGVESGADLYLPKPLSISLLTLSIRNIFDQRQKLKERYLKYHHIEARELVHSSKDKEFMDKLLNTIDAQLDNPELNIDDICSAVNMSRTKLYHKIKQLSGQSPNEFIRSVRLKKAVEMLIHEDVSLTEVQFRIGMQNQSYFSKAFKKEFGKSPTLFMQDMVSNLPKKD